MKIKIESYHDKIYIPEESYSIREGEIELTEEEYYNFIETMERFEYWQNIIDKKLGY